MIGGLVEAHYHRVAVFPDEGAVRIRYFDEAAAAR
jgi:hypothetical protein